MKHRLPPLLFKSLVQSIFLHGTIETSQEKAKAIKGLIDKIINFAKDKKRIHLLQRYLVNKKLQERLIKEIVPKLDNRVSGYTSLIKLGPRLGDRSMMVRMSLIGAEELKPIKRESRVESQESSDENKVKSQKLKVKNTNKNSKVKITKEETSP